MKACLSKLGLNVNKDDAGVPSLSRLHLSATDPSVITNLMESLSEIVVHEDRRKYIKAENDTFVLEKPDAFNMQDLSTSLPDTAQTNAQPNSSNESDVAQQSDTPPVSYTHLTLPTIYSV